MRARLVFILCLMLTGAAAAQVPEDPTARIAWLQAAEHELLDRRRSLLDQEARLTEPLWIVSEDGLVAVVDGAPLFDNVATLAEFAASYGLDETLGPDANPVARAVAEIVAAGQAKDVRAAVKAAYTDTSEAVRAAALASIERQLEDYQEAVAHALQERDGPATTEPAGADWRARLERFGGSLPVPENALVDSPQYNPDRCEVSPIMIVVRGEGRSQACSSGNWRYLGGGLVLPKGTGRCVWCPSGYRWRSGVGCCVPD